MAKPILKNLGIAVAVLMVSALGPQVSTESRADPKPEASKGEAPDAGRGKALAERLCVNCHVVGADSQGAVPEGVPSFRVIANKPGQTADHIRAILIKPHAPMPNIDLTRSEIDDLISYLDELRLEASGPPLLKDDGKDAIPDYPEPT